MLDEGRQSWGWRDGAEVDMAGEAGRIEPAARIVSLCGFLKYGL